MRIISGKYKSRKIHSVITSGLRPSSDRTRETLFNILTHRIEINDALCLDLFAGTGAYGFEALSRGAASCTFVDSSAPSLALIRKTSQELGCSEKIETVKAGSLEFLRHNSHLNFDLIFADPPYRYDKYKELIELVLKSNFKAFILECSLQTHKDLSVLFKDNFVIIDKTIGKTALKILFPL